MSRESQDGLSGVVQIAGDWPHHGFDDDEPDGETVKVDRRMLGVFELDAAELELVDRGALRDEEVFSLDSEPKRTPAPVAALPPAKGRGIDWALIASAGGGGLLGAVVAVWWALA
jgi:hypothetical protein